MAKGMNCYVFRIFIFLLIFSPLAFGTVEPWSLGVMEFLSLLSLALFLYWKRREREPSLYDAPGLVPLSLFLVYVLLQLVPLPPGVLRIVSPGTYALYKETLWAADPLAWGSVSIQKKATLSEFFRLASYGAFYILTVQLLAKKELLKKTVGIVAVFSAALAFFGIVQHFLWNNKIYWIRELTMGGGPFGPYVNRNHYAGFIDMVLPLVVCLFIYYRPRYFFNVSLRDRAVEVFSNPRTNQHVLLGFSAVLLATSVFLSLSKGGIISLCLSMVFLAGMIRNKAKEGKGWILVAFILTIVFYSAGWFGWDKIFSRFAALRDVQGGIAELRLGIWRDSLGLLKDFPVTGTGLGSYLRIYPRYRSISAEGIVDHAHNDYLELISEGGGVAVLLFGWFVAAVFHGAYKGFRRRRDRYAVFLFFGAVSGIVSMLIHSLTDFNLHIGANGLYFFFLLGLAVSAANTRTRDGLNDTFLEKARSRMSKWLICPAAVVFIMYAAFGAGAVAARFSMLPGRGMDEGLQMSAGERVRLRNTACRASVCDPMEAGYPYAAAAAEWAMAHMQEAVEQSVKAVRLDPVNAEYLQVLGLRLAKSGGADRAPGLLLSGIRCDRMNPGMYRRYALWLIAKGDKERAVEYLRTAVALEPLKTRKYVTSLVLYGWTDNEIRGILPDMAKPHLLFADYLDKTRREEMAAEEYRNAVDYIKREKGSLTSSPYYQAYGFFIKKGMYDDALTVMRRAEEALPNDAGVRVTLAETYEKAGIFYRAVEEYEKALVLDPGNDRARKKLDALKQ